MLRTDHKPNVSITDSKTKQYDTLTDEIMQYQPFRLEYLRGKDMFADVLSRPPGICNSIEVPPGFNLSTICSSQRTCPGLRQFFSDDTLRAQYQYSIVNKILRQSSGQVIVPRKFRKSVLHSFHDRNGHLSAKLTLSALSRSFSWPNMSADTNNYIASCNICQQANPAVPKTRLPLQSYSPPAFSFGDRFHLDLVDMPRSAQGHVAICTIVDAATGFVIVSPCQDKTSNSVISALRTKVFPHYGCPKLIVSDKGKENVNKEVASFLRQYHIPHRVTSTGHPQSNGLVERRQRMIISFFRKLVDSPKTQALWDEALPDFQTVINSSSSTARKHSPFFLTFFRFPNFPFQSLLTRVPSLDQASSVEARLNFSVEILQQAAEHLRAETALSKQQFDKQVFLRSFPVGCKVFVHTSERFGLSKKLAKPYKGPYVCLHEGKNGNLHLLPIGGGKTIHVHKNNCKLAPYRSQHLLANEPDPDAKTNPLSLPSTKFKYSSFDPPLPGDEEPAEADVSDEPDTPPVSNSPPDPDTGPSTPPEDSGNQDYTPSAPPAPDPPDDGGARARVPPPMPTDYRQNEGPGPPRTRFRAKTPGQELPSLPGIGYDKTSLERFLAKQLKPKPAKPKGKEDPKPQAKLPKK